MPSLKPQGPRYSSSFGPCAADGKLMVYPLRLRLSLETQRCFLPLFLSTPHSSWKHFSSSFVFASWSQTPTQLQTHLHEKRALQCTNTLCSQTSAHAHWIFNLCPIFLPFWFSAMTAVFPRRQVFSQFSTMNTEITHMHTHTRRCGLLKLFAVLQPVNLFNVLFTPYSSIIALTPQSGPRSLPQLYWVYSPLQ